MKSKTLREGAKCPVDICSAPTGVERRRTAAMWKMSLKRPAAGGESCKTGFFLSMFVFFDDSSIIKAAVSACC